VSGRAFSTKGNAWPFEIDVFAITVYVRPKEVRRRSLPLFYRGSREPIIRYVSKNVSSRSDGVIA
jgi:hypothetical protein